MSRKTFFYFCASQLAILMTQLSVQVQFRSSEHADRYVKNDPHPFLQTSRAHKHCSDIKEAKCSMTDATAEPQLFSKIK